METGIDEFCRTRLGSPRFRTLLERGDPATIVAFGTSMTASGEYLSSVVPAFEAAYPQANVRLERRGRNGFCSVLAAFDAQSIVADRPDLVILEFSVNDRSDASVPLIVPALLGIMTQIRAALPRCEFVFAYYARPDDATGAGRRAIAVHETLAERFGIPSIDLAQLSAQLVAAGAATYRGDTGHALTRDGVHHSGAAARLVGEPFGAALRAVVATAGPPDGGPQLQAVDVPPFAFDAVIFGTLIVDRFDLPAGRGTDSLAHVAPMFVPPYAHDAACADATFFERARRISPKTLVAGGDWGLGAMQHKVDNLDYGEELLVALGNGATLRLPACGGFACVMGFASGGALTVRIDGAATLVRPPPVNAGGLQQVWPLVITNGLDDRPHDIEIAADDTRPAFSDIFFIQPPGQR